MKRLMIVAFVACAASLSSAKTCVWTGAAGGNYIYAHNAANWQDGQVPADGDTVVLSTTSSGTIVYNLTATFENFYFTNTCGGTLSADRGTVRVSGTDSKVVNVQAGGIFFYCPFYVETGARLEFVEKEGYISFAGGTPFNGTGEFTLSGEKGDCGISVGSPDFHGTLNLRRGVIFTSSGQLNDPFGASDAVVNVYGASTDPAFAGCSATLTSYRPVRFSNKFNFYHGTSMTMNPQQTGDVIATYDGDVTYTAGGGKTVFQMDVYGSAGTRVGHVFNGAFTVTKDSGGYLQTINYGSATHYLELNGETYFGDSSGNFLDLGRSGSTCSKVYFGGPFSIKHSFLLNLKDNSEYYTTAPNVLPAKTLVCRYYWDGKGNAKNTFLDLQGHDQRIGPIDYKDDQVIDNVTYVNESVLKSTGGPATLHTFNNNGNVSQIVPYLGGQISVFCYAAPNGNGSLQFPKGGDTTGWIGTEHKTITFVDTSFPNLGGIECTANGSVMIGQNVVLNPNMTLSTHDLTTGLGIRIRDGVNVNVKHVFADNVDVPAGVYCRTGGGVTGATEVPWLVRTQWDPDQSKGTVTVAEHDPVWIWTGGGSKTSFADAANWGANAAPDLSNAKLTLNLGNAAGKADAVVPLDGTVNPAGAINMGDYSKGAVTFGGKGTLVLDGADADHKMIFTQSSSLTWNGPGTLVLTGRSTSRGTLTVAGGRVVMDFADWPGKIIVEEGAELVVNESCVSRCGVYSGPCVLGASNTPGFLMILQ